MRRHYCPTMQHYFTYAMNGGQLRAIRAACEQLRNGRRIQLCDACATMRRAALNSERISTVMQFRLMRADVLRIILTG